MMPTFLIIGAAKGGTTSLHSYLGQHPDLFMSRRKELQFFPWEGRGPEFRGPGSDEILGRTVITSVEEYRSHFADAAPHQARGESTPVYLYFPRAAERIRHHIPDAKLIAVLRQPAERAYSHYLMLRREGWETLGFEQALAAEERRMRDGWSHTWHYLRRGFYAAQLAPYLELFSREQLKLYLYEDLMADPVGLAQDIFRFLGVDDTFAPDVSRRHNEFSLPRRRRLYNYLSQSHPSKELMKRLLPGVLLRRVGDGVRRLNRTQTRPPFPDELRRHLVDLYREDILKLQDILRRDLSHWLR
jgi:hypothetical protein